MSTPNTVKCLAWAIVSVIAWYSTLLIVKGFYPDWDEKIGGQIAVVIRGVLIVSWSLWLISFFLKTKIQLHLWFKIGVCIAVLLSVIRLFFFREMIEFFNLFLQNGRH
jgi:hypothetical protein